jgi:uncharacterized repeat protein (TIGR03803 family)
MSPKRIEFVLYAVLLLSGLASSQTLTVLHSFNGTDGAQPQARLISDGGGNLYGITYAGGAANLGTIFKLDSSEQLTVLHSFNTDDGTNPAAPLLLGRDGSLYGTTSGGGSLGYGTVFRLDVLGNYTVLHNFVYTQGDGAGPTGGLVQDAAGNIYGTTGGAGTYGIGVIFKIDPSGTESVYFNFTDYSDGNFIDVGGRPWAGLAQDQSGNFYGSNLFGGWLGSPCKSRTLDNAGCGTIFRINSSGTLTGVAAFHGTNGLGMLGAKPYGEVTVDAAGKVSGTTAFGGTAGYGTVFQSIGDLMGGFHMHSFAGPPQDGAYPYAGLVEDGAGNLYGTTRYGTTVSNTGCFNGPMEGCGTVFKFDSSGNETVEYSFNPSDGLAFPTASLLLDSSGVLYGTTEFGGASGMGGIFKIEIPGVVGLADFSLSASDLTPPSVTAGASASSTIEIGALGGFSGSASLTCYVQPSPDLAPKCSVSPSSVSPGGSSTLTLTTTSAKSALHASVASFFYAACLPLFGIALVGVRMGSHDKRWKSRTGTFSLISTLFVALVLQLGCGGNSNSNTNGGGGGGGGGTPSGNYTITVTAVSGSIQHSVVTTLTVQ